MNIVDVQTGLPSIYDLIAKTSLAMTKSYNKEQKKNNPRCVREIQENLIGVIYKNDVIQVMESYIEKHG